MFHAPHLLHAPRGGSMTPPTPPTPNGGHVHQNLHRTPPRGGTCRGRDGSEILEGGQRFRRGQRFWRRVRDFGGVGRFDRQVFVRNRLTHLRSAVCSPRGDSLIVRHDYIMRLAIPARLLTPGISGQLVRIAWAEIGHQVGLVPLRGFGFGKGSGTVRKKPGGVVKHPYPRPRLFALARVILASGWAKPKREPSPPRMREVSFSTPGKHSTMRMLSCPPPEDTGSPPGSGTASGMRGSVGRNCSCTTQLCPRPG